MNNGWLLDTKIVIDLFKPDPAVVAAIAQSTSNYLPVTFLGELYYGAL